MELELAPGIHGYFMLAYSILEDRLIPFHSRKFYSILYFVILELTIQYVYNEVHFSEVPVYCARDETRINRFNSVRMYICKDIQHFAKIFMIYCNQRLIYA